MGAVKLILYSNIVFWVAIGTIVILCVVPAMAPTHNTAKWVFTEFTNNTGYENLGLVFFIGMVNNTSFNMPTIEFLT